MVVNKLMYGCGALLWYQHECDDLEERQNGMGIWLWDVGNVRNELIRGKTGREYFSYFDRPPASNGCAYGHFNKSTFK